MNPEITNSLIATIIFLLLYEFRLLFSTLHISYLNDVVEQRGDINEPGARRDERGGRLDRMTVLEVVLGFPSMLVLHLSMMWYYLWHNMREYCEAAVVFFRGHHEVQDSEDEEDHHDNNRNHDQQREQSPSQKDWNNPLGILSIIYNRIRNAVRYGSAYYII